MGCECEELSGRIGIANEVVGVVVASTDCLYCLRLESKDIAVRLAIDQDYQIC